MTDDDFAAGTSTTGVLDLSGDRVRGTFQYAGDEDWFAISLEANQIVILDRPVGNISTVNVFDPTGLRIAGSGFFETGDAGTYYIAVGGEDQREDDYLLSARTLTNPDTVGQSPDTAEAIEMGDRVTGRLAFRDDADWYAIDVSAGQVVVIDAASSANTLNVYDSVGRIWGADITGFGDTQHLVFSEGGTYYVEARDSVGSYRFSISAGDPDIAGDISTTASIGAGETVSTKLEWSPDGDRDWYAYSYTADEKLRFSLSGDYGIGLAVYDQLGRFIVDGGSSLNFFDLGLAEGTYFIEVKRGRPPGRSDEDYALSATDFGSIQDDYGSNPSTTGVLPVDGSTIAGEIDYDFDEDWFQVSALAGQAIQIEASYDSVGNSYPRFKMYDASGNFVTSLSGGYGNDNGQRTQLMSYEFSEDGFYYFGISVRVELSYTLQSSIITGDDHSSAPSRATKLTIDGPAITASSDFSRDHDMFSFSVDAGELITINVDTGSDDQARFSIYDTYGHEVMRNHYERDDYDDDPTFDPNHFYSPVAGSYYLKVRPDGEYEVSLSSNVGDFGNNPINAGRVILDGASVTGSLDYRGDQDWFALDMLAGESALVTVEGVSGDLFSGALRIHDPFGNVSKNEIGRLASVDFTAEQTGTYFVEFADDARYHRPTPGYGSSYSLTASSYTDDFAASSLTDGQLIIGDSISGTFNYTYDSDWFAIAADKNRVLKFSLEDARGYVSIHNSAGELITELGEDAKNSGNFVYEFQEAGDYFVSVSDRGGNSPQNYTLTTTEIIDPFTGGTDTAGVLTVGGAVSGRAEFGGDKDWFAVDVTAGQLVDFFVDQRGYSGLYVLRDDAGNFLGATHSNTTLRYEFEDGGRYFVGISPRFEVQGSRAYELSAVEVLGGEGTDAYSLDRIELDGPAIFGKAEVIGRDATSSNYALAYEWYSVELEAYGSVYFESRGVEDIRILDSSGELVGRIDPDSDYERPFHVFDEAGIYYLGVGARPAPIEYSLELQLGHAPIEGDRAWDSFETAGTLARDGSAVSDVFVSVTDVDYLKFEAIAGEVFLFDTGVNGHRLELLDENGGQLDNVRYSYHRAHEELIYEFQHTGTYYLAAHSGWPDFDEEYRPGNSYTVRAKKLNETVGTGEDDVLSGTDGNDRFSGRQGEDEIHGSRGNDRLSGGSGDDALFGGRGADILAGGDGADAIDGGEGRDNVYYTRSTEGVTIDLYAGTGLGGTAEGDTLMNVERVIGSAFDDTLIGDGAFNNLFGRDGDDVLNGGEGTDYLVGGAGADVFVIGMGDGKERVRDFESGTDKLDVSEFGVAAADAIALAVQNGAHTVINFGNGDRLIIDNMIVADLREDDFIV